MKAERVVVDTNVLISAMLAPPGSAGGVLRHLAQHKATLLLSTATFLELATRLSRPKFDRYRTAEQADNFLDWLADAAEWVEPAIRIDACRDPDDNRFLELLIGGDADVLISGDSDLLQLDPFDGRPILRPADFLAAVAEVVEGE